MPLLEARGIKKRFGGVVALSNGNLKCDKGRITGLLGSNGSGKSTLAKIITGMIDKDEGSVVYNGIEISYKNPHEAKSNGIAMVHQNLSLIPDLTVWQNIVLGNEVINGLFIDSAVGMKISKSILDELMPGLDLNKKISQLNAGEKQIVEIAKAISINPQLLILDEPTAALEQEEVRNLFKYMRKLASKGVAMVFTSHRLWEIEEICDDIIIYRNGRDVAEMNFDEIEKDKKQITQLLTGEASDCEINKEYCEITTDYALEINHLNYGKKLQDISLKVRKGEVLGIGGLAGQGQNELMLALSGNYKKVKMKAFLDKNEINLNKPTHAVRNGIFLVPGDRQKEGLFMKNTVYENMLFAKMGRKHPLFISKKQYRKETEEIVKALSIKTDGIDAEVSTLSGGNQQKVVVGKWLPFDIKVLLLADPAKGIDVAAKKELYEFIMKLVKEKEMSVILYASDDEELINYCDRVNIMYEGKIVSELECNEITSHNIIISSMQVKEANNLGDEAQQG